MGKADNAVEVTKALQDITNPVYLFSNCRSQLETVWTMTRGEEETASSQETPQKGTTGLHREP